MQVPSSAERQAQLVCRLPKLLAHRKEVEGSFHLLEQAITRANVSAGNPPRSGKVLIDRRKLKRLADGDTSVTLSIDELIVLNVYFVSYGGGDFALQPLFEHAQPLRELAQEERVIFFLGSKPFEVEYISRWDFAGLVEIDREMQRFPRPTTIDFEEVLLRQDAKEAARTLQEKWAEHFDDRRTSLVSLGSSRANHASELMGARMFAVAPFSDTSVHGPALPFQFVWSDRRRTSTGLRAEGLPFPSSFALHAQQVRHLDAAAAREVSKGGAALRIGDKVFVAERPREGPTRSYGVVCLQRRENGALWIAVMGLSGQTTLACSLALKSLPTRFPPHAPERHSAVRWAVVEAHLGDSKPHTLAEIRQLLSWQTIDGPHDWEPPAEPDSPAAAASPSRRASARRRQRRAQ